MRICDLTMAYTATSGGIRRYIDRKREYLLSETEHEHQLIIPGPEDEIERDGRAVTCRVASPVIPGCEPYRFFWRPDKICRVLDELAPDVIEVASHYVCPWAAFSHRAARAEAGEHCLVCGYFHTDIARAYVDLPLRKRLGDGLADWSEHLAGIGLKLAKLLAGGAEDYLTAVFGRCDLMLAATGVQAARVREHGIERVEVVPLGVDLDRFHPDRREPAIRRELGIDEDVAFFIYGGRLHGEKHVETLVEAYDRLPEDFDAHLVLVGEGPLREQLTAMAEQRPGLHILPYEQDTDRFAGLLAAADVYVSAGPHETFALSVIEAMACALPVVGVEAGALRERLGNDRGRLVPVDDAAVMAAAMTAVYHQRYALGAAARRHVVERFSWERTFHRLIALYEAEHFLHA